MGELGHTGRKRGISIHILHLETLQLNTTASHAHPARSGLQHLPGRLWKAMLPHGDGVQTHISRDVCAHSIARRVKRGAGNVRARLGASARCLLLPLPLEATPHTGRCQFHTRPLRGVPTEHPKQDTNKRGKRAPRS